MGIYIDTRNPMSCVDCFYSDCKHWEEARPEKYDDCPIFELDIDTIKYVIKMINDLCKNTTSKGE